MSNALHSYTPDRAVIDIGSNTVRLVVYAGSRRAPRVWLNESAGARLGRDLSVTGAMPDKAVKQALGALARYATILADLQVSDVQTVATAAVRDAANGPAFLAQVGALGLSPRLLSGEEEARGSAYGVIGAFPNARGTVADIGGGSLELVRVADGACGTGISLPLGTLRLPALQALGADGFAAAIASQLRPARATFAPGEPLYMVGGTWRAFAAYAIHAAALPVTDPHGFALETAAALRLAKEVARLTPDELASIPGISVSRAAGLPDAAAMLRVVLGDLAPASLVFSAWGLREGLLFERLSSEIRAQDPLLAAVTDFASPRGGSEAMAHAAADWLATALGAPAGPQAVLRVAATQLALAAAHLESNLRARQAFEWAMEKRWIGLDPGGRGWLGAALLAAAGKIEPPAALAPLADREALREAAGWGLAVRLARRLDPGNGVTLAASRLQRDGDRLVLRIDPRRAHVATSKVQGDLKNLARWMALKPEIESGPE